MAVYCPKFTNRERRDPPRWRAGQIISALDPGAILNLEAHHMNIAGNLTRDQEVRCLCLQSALDITAFNQDADASDVMEVAIRFYRFIILGADTIYETHRNAPGSVRTVGDIIAMVEKAKKAAKP